MIKRCPRCESDNSLTAVRCRECGHEFSQQPTAPPLIPGPPDAKPDLPTVPDAPSVSPVAPAAPTPSVTEDAIAELAHTRALVAQLEEDAVDREAHLATLKAQVEQLLNEPRPNQPAAPVVPIVAGTQPLISRALVSLSKWPRAVMLALGVIGVGGAGFGGWTLARPGPERHSAEPAPTTQSDRPSPTPGAIGTAPVQPVPDAVVSDANLREKQRLEDVRIDLEKKEALVTKNDADVKALDASVQRDRAELAARQTAFSTQEAALKGREAAVAAQARVRAGVEPRMGYVDFTLREVKNVPYFTATEAMMQGDGSTWPKQPCTVVAISPLDGDDRPTSIAASCTPAGIVINKLKGLKNGHTVRLVWQLK